MFQSTKRPFHSLCGICTRASWMLILPVPAGVDFERMVLGNTEGRVHRMRRPGGKRFAGSSQVTPGALAVVVGEVHQIPGRNRRQEHVLIERQIVDRRGGASE